MSYYRNRDTYGQTKVEIHWSLAANAFQIYFVPVGYSSNGKAYYQNKERFAKIKDLLTPVLKNIPLGDREQVCKIETPNMSNPNYKIEKWFWYVSERYVIGESKFKEFVEMFPEDFVIDFIPKPDETSNFQSKEIPIEILKDKFRELTGELLPEDFKSARSIYRRMCARYHPDRNPNSDFAAKQMSSINEIWSDLELRHFKTKEPIVYA